MGNFHNLDNEEILFIYLQNKKFLDKYNSILNQKGYTESVDLIESHDIYVDSFYSLSEEELLEIEQSPHYLYCKKVDECLAPLVELITGSFPELYTKVFQSFNSEPNET